MFIEAISHYIPEQIISNAYFKAVNGLDEDWIVARTGIKNRTKATKSDNTNTMGIKAVDSMKDQMHDSLKDVDLIVGGSYSPYDTVGTLAHAIQREFNIIRAKAVYLSSACSSFINAVEVVEGYFATGKASKALIVVSEHNTAYSNERDEKSGHLWGDGAAAVLLKKEEIEAGTRILDVFTEGLGHIGRGPNAVYLHPLNGGLQMPHGKDVFINACNYMIYALEYILEKNNMELEQVDYVIPHQANIRIINHIAHSLEIPHEKMITNIEELGNTGSASTLIALSQNLEQIGRNKTIAFTVFGGGYSTGSMLIRT